MQSFNINAIGQVSIVREIGMVQMGHKRRRFFECRCVCGETMTVRSDSVRRTKSCMGCKHKADAVRAVQDGGISFRIAIWLKSNQHNAIKHGESNKTPEYRAWRNMVTRCTYQKCKRWIDYGGRGISICQQWINSYETFLSDMGRRPSPKHSLDRKDNDGNYEPGNCRWATGKEQRRNRRR